MSDQSDKSSLNSLDELKESLGALRTRIFRRSVDFVGAGDGRESPSTPADLDALAEVNEDIRERCLGIVNRAEQLLALRSEFVDICGEVGKILRRTEATTSALLERSATLAHEEEEHDALKARYHALHDDYEKTSGEQRLLRSEAEGYGELVLAREARIQALEQELSDEKNSGVALSAQLEQERCANTVTTDKLKVAFAEVSANETLAADLKARGAEFGDRSSAAESDASALEAQLAESQAIEKTERRRLAESEQNVASFSRRLQESASEVAALQSRLAAIEAALSRARRDHEAAQSLWREKDQAAADEIADLNAELGAIQRRIETADAQAAEARAELIATSTALRAREQEVDGLNERIATLEGRLAKAAEEIARLGRKTVEGERASASLADHAQALVRAMSDQGAKLELAEMRAELLEKRLSSETARFAADRETLERKIHDLNEGFERERAARTVAAGALEAARSRIAQKREATTLHDILVRADQAAQNELSEPLGHAVVAVSDAKVIGLDGGAPEAASAGVALLLPKSHPLVVKREATRRRQPAAGEQR
jgi:chromosome segregation ATPase